MSDYVASTLEVRTEPYVEARKTNVRINKMEVYYLVKTTHLLPDCCSISFLAPMDTGTSWAPSLLLSSSRLENR